MLFPPTRVRESGQSCLNCVHFADHFDPDEDPEEVDGYCCYDHDVGNRWNEYGGHWTHSESWCSEWELYDGTNGWSKQLEERELHKKENHKNG